MNSQKFSSFRDLLKELATKEIKILLVLFTLFLSLFVFINVGMLVTNGTTKQFDESIIKYFRVEGNNSEPTGPYF